MVSRPPKKKWASRTLSPPRAIPKSSTGWVLEPASGSVSSAWATGKAMRPANSSAAARIVSCLRMKSPLEDATLPQVCAAWLTGAREGGLSTKQLAEQEDQGRHQRALYAWVYPQRLQRHPCAHLQREMGRHKPAYPS